MANILTASEIVNAANGFLPSDWFKSESKAKEFQRLLSYGKNRRAWNLAISEEEKDAKKELGL